MSGNTVGEFDVWVARAVSFIAAFVGVLTVIGPLFFIYVLLNKGQPVHRWDGFSLGMYAFIVLFTMGVLRIKVMCPWSVAVLIPLSQVAFFCYLSLSIAAGNKTPDESVASAAKPQMQIHLIGNHDGTNHVEMVKKAALELVKACPPVANVKNEIEVEYEEGSGMAWRGEKLGWKSDFYFNVDDSQGSGHHHHFYLRQDGPRELVIDGKQVTLDWCGIAGTMKDYYLLAL